RAHVAQRTRKLCLAFVDAGKTAHELDTDAGERVEVYCAAIGKACKLKRWHVARPHDIVDLIVTLVEHAARVHPPLDIPAAIDTGHPHMFADCDGHLPARTLDFIRDLNAG